MSWFTKVKTEVKLIPVEIEKGVSKLTPLTKDLREQLHAVSLTPAIQYLLTKMKYERSFLERQLREAKHATLDEVSHLQHGIYWSKWLERHFQLAEQKGMDELHAASQALSEGEQAALQEIESAVNLVGREV